MKNEKQKIISGALSLTVSALIVKAVGLIYKIPLSYMLSEEGMAYFNSAYTVYTFFYIICTAGVPKAISILVSACDAEGDVRKSESIYRSALIMFSAFGGAFSILLAIFAYPISSSIGSSGSALTMLAVSPSVFFVCASGVIRGYFNGKLELLAVAISEILGGALRLVVGLLFAMIGVRLGFSLSIISAMTILGTSLGAFVGYIYLLICAKKIKSREKEGQKTSKEHLSFSIIKEIGTLAIPMTLTSAIGSLGGIIDLGIIMRRLLGNGYSELQSGILYGNFTTLVVPMVNLIATLIGPITAILLPMVSRDAAKNDKKILSKRISFSTMILSYVCIPISFLYYFESYPILAILFEDQSAAMAAPLLSAMAPGIMFMSLLTVINTALEGVGKTLVPLVSVGLGSVLKLILTFILMSNGNIGLFGATEATVISYIFSFIVSYTYAFFALKVHISIIRQMLVPLVSSCGAYLLIKLILSSNVANIYFYLLKMILFAFVYVALITVFNLKNAKKLSKYTKKVRANY